MRSQNTNQYNKQDHQLIIVFENDYEKILTYIGADDETPEYMKCPHITHGYRLGYNCSKKLFKTLITLHNQTINIWTHLLPALLICITLIYLLLATLCAVQQILPPFLNVQEQLFSKDKFLFSEINKKPIEKCLIISQIDYFNNFKCFNFSHSINFSNVEYSQIEEINSNLNQALELTEVLQSNQISKQLQVWPIYQFLIATMICLSCSTIFHLFHPLSFDHFIKFQRLDLSGIFLLISSSSGGILYYGLYCNQSISAFYMIVNGVLGIGLFFVSLSDWFYQSKMDTIRTLSCIGYAAFASIPLFHIILAGKLGFLSNDDTFSHSQVDDDILMVIGSYSIGVLFYAFKIPQKFYPGKFNIFGHSHQIWHCFVNLGILLTYNTIIQQYKIRQASQCIKY